MKVAARCAANLAIPARIVILSELREPKDIFSMCQRSSSCPPLPGSLCSGSAFFVTFQPANAVLAPRALRRDLLAGESHLPHDFSCLFSPPVTRHCC